MRIMHLVEFPTHGGLETHIICLLKELKKMGHTSCVFAMRMGDIFEKELKREGIEYYVDLSPGDGLKDFINQRNIQVLHAHPAQTIGITKKLGKELQKPVAATYHTLWTGGVDESIGKIICVSQAIRDQIAKSDPHLIPKLTVIQNGIDTDLFKPAKDIGDGRKMVFLGRIDAEKYFALKIIINALKLIDRAKLLVPGTGPFNEILKNEAPPFVKCLGYVDDLPPVINEADIVIGTGRGVREGMACGRITISLDGTGYDGLVTLNNIKALEWQNFSGRSGKSTDAKSFLHDVNKVINNGELRVKLAEWGRKYAVDNYSSAAFTLKHLVIYSDLLNKMPGGS